jgi:nitrite reductase/ring-hydroxylating ferredoxin subunit
MIKKTVEVLLLILVLAACNHSYEVYSNKYQVSFFCDISVFPFNKVQTSGYFLTLRPTVIKDGYKVKDSDGREQTIPYTEVHSRIFSFGLAGLIIGKPYFGEGEYYAYDLGCPHCDRASSPLSIDNEGIATCSKCNNTYDLNNGGIAKTGNNRPLYRYRTTLNGNMLMIHN